MDNPRKPSRQAGDNRQGTVWSGAGTVGRPALRPGGVTGVNAGKRTSYPHFAPVIHTFRQVIHRSGLGWGLGIPRYSDHRTAPDAAF